jgi:hypothetical protein
LQQKSEAGPGRGAGAGNFLLTPGSGLLYVSRMEKPNQLGGLFRMQKALNKRIGAHAESMNEQEKNGWILLKSLPKHMLERTVN